MARPHPVSATALVCALCAVCVLSVVARWPRWIRGPDEAYVLAAEDAWAGRFGIANYDDDAMRDRTGALTGNRVRDILSPTPPSLAVLLLPLAWIPGEMRAFVWLLLNVAAVLATAALLAGVVAWPTQRPWLGLCAASAVLLSDPLAENLSRGQVYLLLMPAIASVLVASATDRAAGVVGLAICTAAKLWGGFVWMGLVAAGAWRLVAISAFATATLFTTSLCVANIETWRHYFENVVPEWLTTTRITVTAYQTVPAFFAHLLRADPQWNPEPLADLPALALALSLIGAGSMLGVTLWAAAVKHLRLPAIAAAAVLAVLYAPLAEQYHYLLIVPSVVVAAERCFLQPGYRTALLTLMPAVALLILPLPYKSSELAEFAGGVFAYPRVVGALMVWTLLVWPLPAAPTTR